MLKDQLRPGMQVNFGRPNGEKTLAVVEKLNPSKAKLRTLEGRGQREQVGQIWHVPYSLIHPADGAAPVNLDWAKAQALASLRGVIKQFVSKYGAEALLEAIPAHLLAGATDGKLQHVGWAKD
jgi:hypothetical protein